MESSKSISEKIAQESLEVNLFYVILGLVTNILISAAIIIPTDLTKVKDLKITPKNFWLYMLIAFGLKIFIFNELFGTSNDVSSFIVVALMSILMRIIFDIFLLKLERYKLNLFDNDILYLLIIGQIFFAVSVGSSSFIEEEHQIWYYFCNAMFIILTFYEFRGRRNLESFIGVGLQCFPVLVLHIVIRRMNQTGDKWINLQDIGDWLHRKENEEFLHVLILISLAATAVWMIYRHVKDRLLVPFVTLGCFLLYFHHSRSMVTERLVFLLGIELVYNYFSLPQNRHLNNNPLLDQLGILDLFQLFTEMEKSIQENPLFCGICDDFLTITSATKYNYVLFARCNQYAD